MIENFRLKTGPIGKRKRKFKITFRGVNITFITAIENVEESIHTKNGTLEPKKYKTFRVNENKAKELLEDGKFVKRAWQCPRCNELHTDKNYDRKPPFCQNPNCSGKELIPVHPEEHNEIGSILMETYTFKTMKETGEIYHYNGNKKFENKTSEALIKEETRDIIDDCSSHDQNEVVEYVRTCTYEPKKNFGLPKNKLALENGILNIETRELEEFKPEDQIPLAKIPVHYDPEADCPKIKEFLHDIFKEEDLDVIQEFVGYCLWKDYPYAKALVLLGEGSNGKSTFINLLTNFLGKDNISSNSLRGLLSKETVRKDLYGKLANLAAETPDALYNTDNFKKMTGQDMIRGRRLYQEGFKFQNYAKLVFAANELPETDDYTHAFFRRIMLVDCPYRFTKDPNDGHKNADPSLPESILDEEELSGLLNWALDGLNRLLNQGGFSETKTRKEIKERWIRETDPERGFIEKFIETDYNTFLVRSDIHEAYKEYCEEHELEAKDQGPLTKAINSTMTSASKYTPQVDGKRQKSFKNIKLTGEFSEYNRQLSEQGKEGKQVDDNQGKLDDVTDVTVKNDKKRLEKENRSNKSSSENPVTRVTDEVENLGNPNCEVCEDEMGLEKEAERKVSRNGEDLWLCESCLQDMGYETEEGGTSQ